MFSSGHSLHSSCSEDKKTMDKENKLIEVVRSYSFKLNAGNYESRDFFCSQKAECYEDEAIEASERLHAFCENEVMKAVEKNKQKAQFKSISKVERKEKAGFEVRDNVDMDVSQETI